MVAVAWLWRRALGEKGTDRLIITFNNYRTVSIEPNLSDPFPNWKSP
jgi:hypothetical protein